MISIILKSNLLKHNIVDEGGLESRASITINKRTPICGDSLCEREENCEKDQCCNGQQINLINNPSNCGQCQNACTIQESCVDGACKRTTYCGDGVCSIAEICGKDNCCGGKRTSLRTDPLNCGLCNNKCAPDVQCENGQCVTAQKQEIVQQPVKKESTVTQEPEVALQEPQPEIEQKKLADEKKKLGDLCTTDQECTTDYCNNEKCTELSFFQRIWTWFLNVFG